MSQTIEDICNFALFAIAHTRAINNIDENSVESRHCKRIYDQLRRALLTRANWHFAKTIVTLEQTVGTPPGDWLYEYYRPAGVIAVREIIRSSKLEPKIKFTSGTTYNPDTGVDKQVIWTNQYQAQMLVTRDITLTTHFSPNFSLALSYRMAMDLALVLADKAAYRKEMERMFMWHLSEAERLGEIETQDDPVEQDAAWITDR